MSFQNGPCFRGLLFLWRVYQLAQNSPRRSFHTIGWHPPNSFWKFRYLFSHHPDYFWKILKHSILSPFFGEDSKTEFFYHNRFWQRSDLITVLNFKKNYKQKKHMLYHPHINLWPIGCVFFSLPNLVVRTFPIFPPVLHLLTSNGCRWMKWNPDGIFEARFETQWTKDPSILQSQQFR